MSVNHTDRLHGLIKAHLKTLSLGQPFGFAISGPGTVPIPDEQGNAAGIGVGWTMMVSIPHPRPALVDADLRQEIASSFPIPGVLPADRLFTQVAERLFQNCMAEVDKINATPAMVGRDLTNLQLPAGS